VEVLEALWPTLTSANEHGFRLHVKRYPLCFVPTTLGFSADAWVTGPQEVCYKVSLHAVSILDTDYAQCEKDMIAGGGKNASGDGWDFECSFRRFTASRA
jgi:hypothetical protein